MNPKQSDRRRFLKNGAALAGLAVGASAGAAPLAAEPVPEKIDDLHQYGERSHFVDSIRTGSINNPERKLPNEPVAFGLRTPLQDSVGMITPNSLHYIVSHGYEAPDINPAEHRLLIHGMVDRPLIFTLDELKRLPSVSRFHFIECHGNSSTAGPGGPERVAVNATVQDTHGFTSCSQWTGVPLSLLLKEAGVQKGASWIVAEGSDANKHSKSFPLAKAIDDVIVAYGQNGEAVRPEQGYPLRLVVPGWQGINNVKWLRRIALTDEPQMAMMATMGTELYTKYVIVVDDDVDIFNMNDVMWAIATRVRAEKDIVFVPGSKSAILDPTSDPKTFTVTKMGIDATRPSGIDFAERLVIGDAQRARARSLLEAAGITL